MTDPAHTPAAAPRRKRLSKRVLRAWAWILGVLAFAAPWAALGLQPKPVAAAAAPKPPEPRVIHRILRRVVYAAPKPTSAPKVNYVYAPSSSGGYSSSGGGGGGGGAVASSGGSHP